MKYLSLSVDKCSKEKLERKGITNITCASDAEMDDVINNSDVMLVYVSTYCNENIFGEPPINSLINTYYFNLKPD